MIYWIWELPQNFEEKRLNILNDGIKKKMLILNKSYLEVVRALDYQSVLDRTNVFLTLAGMANSC